MLKLQLTLATLMFSAGLLWILLAFLQVLDSLNFAAFVLMAVGLLWMCVARFLMWWKRER